MPDPGAQVNDSVQRMIRGSKVDEEREGRKLSRYIYNWLTKFEVNVSHAREKIPELPAKPELANLGEDQKILMAAGSLFFARLKESEPNIVFDYTPTWEEVVAPLIDYEKAEATIYHYKLGVDPNRVMGKMEWLSEHYSNTKQSDEIYYYMALGSELK
ncbi:hypothetical protein PsorP6_005664 [Peronosclerospora sorghi]|uniref:Uncharacterized protein n=1 Tax=Peronosclerospora sorghi TaxID=230839 RepID=A0ACC0W3Q8_9STRA|nr:hypothetical protein PsorP6_005664 [Peronosclerospora sorghi]